MNYVLVYEVHNFFFQGEKINSLLKAANVKVEPYWPGLFAKATAGLDLKSMVSNIGAGVGSGGGGGAAAASAAPAAAVAGQFLACNASWSGVLYIFKDWIHFSVASWGVTSKLSVLSYPGEINGSQLLLY